MHILPDIDVVTFYAVALYFSCIWGVFFFYMFKTKQVDLKLTASLFFAVQILMFFVWGLGLNKLNIFYALLGNDGFLSNSLGYVLGVGVTEELVKAVPLILVANRSKTPLVPQTMVFLWRDVRYRFWNLRGGGVSDGGEPAVRLQQLVLYEYRKAYQFAVLPFHV